MQERYTLFIILLCFLVKTSGPSAQPGYHQSRYPTSACCALRCSTYQAGCLGSCHPISDAVCVCWHWSWLTRRSDGPRWKKRSSHFLPFEHHKTCTLVILCSTTRLRTLRTSGGLDPTLFTTIVLASCSLSLCFHYWGVLAMLCIEMCPLYTEGRYTGFSWRGRCDLFIRCVCYDLNRKIPTVPDMGTFSYGWMRSPSFLLWKCFRKQ